MQGGGWYKILGRSESLAVKKPSNRGGCDACSGAHRSPTHCTGSQTDFITTSWKSTTVKGNNKMNNTKQCQLLALIGLIVGLIEWQMTWVCYKSRKVWNH